MSSFPTPNASGGVDLRALTPGYASAQATALTLSTVVAITGTGFITTINMGTGSSGTSAGGTLKVTIDGRVVVDDSGFSSTGGTNVKMGNINPMFFFRQSILIEHATGSVSVPFSTNVSYLLY